MSVIVIRTTEPNYNYDVPTTTVDIDEIDQSVEYQSNFIPSQKWDVSYYSPDGPGGTSEPRSVDSIDFYSDSDGNDTPGDAGTTDTYVVNYTYDDIDGGQIASSVSKSSNFSVDLTGKALQQYSITADLEISVTGLSPSIVRNKAIVLTNSSGATRNITWGGSIDSSCWAEADQLLSLPDGSTYIVSIFSFGTNVPSDLFISYVKKGA